MVQPVQQFLGQFTLIGNVLEKFQKYLVEAVIVRLVFHQDGPAQLVEPSEGGAVQALFHALQQHQPFVEGDVQSPLPQQIEKRGKHGALPTGPPQRLQVLVLFQ